MKKIHLLPNLFTAFSLSCGLFVIFKMSMVEPGAGDYEVILTAALLLVVAAAADFVDGTIARAIHAESLFGVIFDSLADAVSFGVAPSVVLLKSLSLQPGNWLSFLVSAGAMTYSLCGILRLVRFDVMAIEKTHQDKKKHFTGLPIPAAAIASVSANLLFIAPYSAPYLDVTHTERAIILAGAMFLIGYLMVCRWKFPSLKVLHFRVPSFHLAFFAMVTSVFVLYGIFHYFSLVLLLISWSYLLLGITLAVIRLFAGKKSKTLEEFEPEPDELD